MEKILNIVEIDRDERSGFEIITSKQIIHLSISNYQHCCENWGYFMSEDNVDSFIGADIIDISLTDTNMTTRKIDAYYGGVMFVNILTSFGLLQFVAYNEHNGYYGHNARVVSNQLNHNESL